MNAPKYQLIFFLFVLISLRSFAQSPYADSIQKVLPGMKDDSEKVLLTDQLAYELTSIGENKKAMLWGNKNLEFAKKINFRRGIGIAYSELGMISEHTGDYDNAIKFHALALKNDLELGNKMRLAACYTNLGIIYDDQSNYPFALQNYFKGLRIAEEIRDTEVIAGNYNNIGAVYQNMGDNKNALHYLILARDIKMAMGPTVSLAITYNSIGDVYQAMDNHTEALSNYFKGFAITTKLNHKRGTAAISNEIGEAFISMNLFDSAKVYLNISLAICEETNDADGKASVLCNLGKVKLAANDVEGANKLFLESLSLSQETGDREIMKECYRNLVLTSENKKDFKSAVAYEKLFIATKDSILNEENTKKTERLQLQYNFDKKTTADSIRNTEQKKQDDLKHKQEIQQQKIYTYGGVIGFLLMVIVAIISFRAFRNKQKANEIISHQKHIVEEKQKEILDSIHYARRIQKSLLPTEKYIQRNLIRLRDRK